MSIFFDKFKYRWEIKDKYGHDIPNREYNLSTLLGIDDYNDINCDICLSIMVVSYNFDDWVNTIINVFFRPDLNLLKIKDLDFYCESIEDAENLIDILIKGSNLSIAPINLKN